MSEAETNEMLRQISVTLGRGYRGMPYKKLEAFIVYFEGFSKDRLDNFMESFKRSVYVSNPEFRLECIVRDDLVNKLSLPSTVSRNNPQGFYNVQVVEVKNE